jgi:hypothetical protein
MRCSQVIWSVVIPFFLLQTVSGQGFLNLNFEQSTIISSRPTGGGFNSGMAKVPDWTSYNGWGSINYPGGTEMVYNNQPLDDPGTSLEGVDYPEPAIQGAYSVFLLGGSMYYQGTNGASIGQTGQIPLGTHSITYWGAGWNSLRITFNGQVLAFTILASTANYAVFGADISAYAGQTGELLFYAPTVTGGGFVDNIQFSSSAIPEPNSLALLGLGVLFFSVCRRNLESGSRSLTLRAFAKS